MIEILGYPLSILLLVVGTILIASEAVIPGAHFIVLGVAVFLTGLVGVIFPPLGNSIAGLTATLLASGVGVYLFYSRLDLYGGSDSEQTRNSKSLVGTKGTALKNVTAGSGRVKLDKSGGFSDEYEARTDNGTIKEGERVEVTDGQGGSVVRVTRIDD